MIIVLPGAAQELVLSATPGNHRLDRTVDVFNGSDDRRTAPASYDLECRIIGGLAQRRKLVSWSARNVGGWFGHYRVTNVAIGPRDAMRRACRLSLKGVARRRHSG